MNSISSTPPHRLGLPAIGWVLLLCLALRLALCWTMPLDVEIDGLAYWTMASNWVDGNGLIDNLDNRAYFNSGYPMLLGVLFAIFGKSLQVVVFANAVLGLIGAYFCYRIAKRLAGERAGCMAALLWSIYPQALFYTTLVAKENLMAPLLLAAIWACVVWPSAHKRIRLSILCGLVVGMTALTGGTALAGGAAFAVVILWQRESLAKTSGHLAYFSLGALLVVSPWIARNQVVLGAPLLNTNSGINLYLGNNPNTTHEYLDIAHTPFAEEWTRTREVGGEVQVDRAIRAQALAYMRDNPRQTAGRFLHRFARFWGPPHIGDPSAGLLERMSRLGWMLYYLGLLAASVASLRFWKRLWPVHLGALGFAAVHSPFFVMARFQLPVVPLLCILAAAYFGMAQTSNKSVRS